MAIKHPYVVGPGGLTKTITHLRKSFPEAVSAQTLAKLGYATNNETYVINTLRFLGLIDGKGNRTAEASKIFSLHGDSAFQPAFGDKVKSAYGELFNLHKDDAWKLTSGDLVSYFRATDQSSEVVGTRQASTFQTLAALAGKSAAPTAPRPANEKGRSPKPRKDKASAKAKAAAAKTPDPVNVREPSFARMQQPGFGLTVRIEVNLPAVPDQATYDAIFASIRKNLIDVG